MRHSGRDGKAGRRAEGDEARRLEKVGMIADTKGFKITINICKCM
jgi:hypothetical protein